MTSKNFPFPARRIFGTGIDLRPLKNCPVIDSATFEISSTDPCATTDPPFSPAPIPISMI